ncbi:MAG: PKD domain-containing protein, partial [Planctomycetes bacterium]|nr:PKD domain-containing protein [Planctomycetota bacterium]
NCIFTGNKANMGGGIHVKNAKVINCTFSENFAYSGGAAYLAGSSGKTDGMLQNCHVVGNTAGSGAGVYIKGFSYADYGGALRNCLIAGNTSSSQGGGVYMEYAGSVLNCTISGNSANNNGGGIYSSSGRIVENSIVWGNTGGDNFYGSAKTNRYNCIQGWSSGGEGNITTDPKLAIPDATDLHILADSPCINTGTNVPWQAGTTDLDGQDRIINGRVDMGAYEVGKLISGLYAAPRKGITPMFVQFTGYATGTNVINVEFLWDLDGDSAVDRQGIDLTTPSNTYSTAGVYSVSLTVSNDVSETSSVFKNDYITVIPPVQADFTSSQSTGTWPVTVHFTDQSQNEPHNRFWDFDNDGVVDSTVENPTHTYWTPGTYSVTLTVSNNFGAGGLSGDSITKTNLVVVHDALHPVHYVSLSGGHVSPFMTWEDAATNPCDAAFVASDGD